jgi:hypothetical protein
MEHPVQHLAAVTKFLDHLIRERGDYLFVGFGFLCLFFLGWILTRRRKRRVHDLPVVILPLGRATERENSPETSAFQESPDL